jgi:hypothetical protein
MWTNNITPGVWGECNTFTVGGPGKSIISMNSQPELPKTIKQLQILTLCQQSIFTT